MNPTKPENRLGEAENLSFWNLKLLDILIMWQGQLMTASNLIQWTRLRKEHSDIKAKKGDMVVGIGLKSLDGKLENFKAVCTIDGFITMISYAQLKATGE